MSTDTYFYFHKIFEKMAALLGIWVQGIHKANKQIKNLKHTHFQSFQRLYNKKLGIDLWVPVFYTNTINL